MVQQMIIMPAIMICDHFEAMRAMLTMTVEAIHPAIGFPLLALLRHLLLNRPEDHCWSEAGDHCMLSPWLHRQRLVARFCQRTQLSASHPRALVEELNIEIIIIIFLILILIIINYCRFFHQMVKSLHWCWHQSQVMGSGVTFWNVLIRFSSLGVDCDWWTNWQ